ncbi:MAG TPA: LuxR C-terminal-related transcriptional regulator [Thermomicrobiales bacterium]
MSLRIVSDDIEESLLPLPPTSFVGRSRDVDSVVALLQQPDVVLLTLTGPSGVGKTRLALQVASTLRGEFNEICFVSLAAIGAPSMVLPTIARCLGLRDEGDADLEERIQERLFGRRTLLVLDNFEQVVSAGPALTALLVACPELKALVTSRQTLRVTGEFEYPVAPLDIASLDASAGLPEVSANEAVTLFVQRARAVRPDFALTETNAPIIAEICRRLDGLPLAIELAAARIKVLSPAALLSRLTFRLELLTGGPRDLPERLQTMRRAVAWSYDLLADEHRQLFRVLSVFPGSFALEAAEAVAERVATELCGENQGDAGALTSVFDGLVALIDASLLQREESDAHVDSESPRFRMLETIREYGLEQLTASGEEAAVRTAHAAWTLSLAETAEAKIWGPNGERWLATLETEHDHLNAALSWLVTSDPPAALRLAGMLWWFWQTRGHLSEGRTWLERALAAAPLEPTWDRAAAQLGAAFLAALQGDTEAAAAHAEAGLAFGRSCGDPACIGRALFTLSFVAGSRGDHERAAEYAAEALDVVREGNVDPWLPFAHNRLGIELYECGDRAAAVGHFEEALARWRAQGHQWGVATALANLARCVRGQGDDKRATALYRESLEASRRVGDTWGIVESLTGLASIAGSYGQAETAARLFAAAERVRSAIGLRLQRYVRTERDEAVDAARRELGEAAFNAAWEAGQALSLDEAAGIAATIIPSRPAPRAASAAARSSDKPAPSDTAGLTPREIEVLRLLSEGKSSREIGDLLFISHRTATTHVANIFTKLDVDNRAAAVAKAFQLGLL